jgi:hypothetical protein
MNLKPAKIINIVSPFAVSGALTARIFSQRFRTFSVHCVDDATPCVITFANGDEVTVPEGTTLNFDAGSNTGVTNTFRNGAFTITAGDCIVIGTY